MKYFAFLENGELPDKDPSYKCIVVLENINGHISDLDAWRGVSVAGNILSVVVLLSNIYVSHGLSSEDTMQGGSFSKSNDLLILKNMQTLELENEQNYKNVLIR